MNENWHIVGCIPANIALKLGMLGRTPIKKIARQSAGLIIVVHGRKQYTRHFFDGRGCTPCFSRQTHCPERSVTQHPKRHCKDTNKFINSKKTWKTNQKCKNTPW